MSIIYYSPSKKGFYDTAVNYPSYPDDIFEVSKEEYKRLLTEHYSNSKIIVCNNNTLTLEEVPVNPLTWDIVRFERNNRLQISDHTQLPDFPEAKKTDWATYRQLLRDIPQTYATPQEVIWPTAPT